MDVERIERLRERLLVCPICMDEYKDPRILPCHHSVCVDCLSQYVRLSTATGRFFRCPQCRQDILVPSGGVQEFQQNFFVSSLQEEIGGKPESSVCELCERSDVLAQFRCVECHMDICRFCVTEHRLFKHQTAKDSQVFRLETFPLPAEVLGSGQSCPKHNEVCNVFCSTCDYAVCLSCVCKQHKSHDTMSLTQKLHLFEKNIDTFTREYESEKQIVGKQLALLNDLSHSLNENFKSVRDDVEKHAENLHSFLEEQTKHEMTHIVNEENKCLSQIEKCRENLDKYRDNVDHVVQFMQDIQPCDVNIEMMTSLQRYRNQLSILANSASAVINYSDIHFKRGIHKSLFSNLLLSFGSLSKTKKTRLVSLTGKMPRATINRDWKTCLRNYQMTCSLVYVIITAVLMSISLVYLSWTYFVDINGENISKNLADKDVSEGERGRDVPHSSSPLIGLLFCSVIFAAFCATFRTSQRRRRGHHHNWYKLTN